jgi:hypothetical protein
MGPQGLKDRGGRALVEEEYLRPTRSVQSDHPEIVECAKRLSHGLSTEQAVKNIYLFVRDQIKWTVEELKPAIEVLRSKKGVCFNKASLQIALLRAVGIPARYRLEEVSSLALKPYLPRELYELLPKTVVHALAEVYLNERWLGCDATLDALLSHPLWKRDWEPGMDLSCIPSAFKVGVLGTYSDLPEALVSKSFKALLYDKRLVSKVEEHLEILRAMSPDEKLRHFAKEWGPNIISQLVKGGKR